MIRRITRTISVKVNPPKEDYLNLLQSCSELFNFYTKFAYENKTYNKNKIHQATYHQLVKENPMIKSALIQTVRDVAMEACKRNKLKGNTPVAKKYSSLRLVKTCFNLRGYQLTLIGSGKRHKEILHIPEIYKEIFETWKCRGATLCYNKHQKQFWLRISFTKDIEVDDIQPITNNNTIGIDRGLYNIVALSNGSITKSNHIRRLKRKYLFNKRKYQQKGTRSAKRHLRALSGKEQRFMKDVNHCLSKQIVNMPYEVFVLEDLKGIRKVATKGKRSKKLNNWISNWSFFQLENMLCYKAEALGKQVVKVDARYTSQKCSCCGSLETNRFKSKFVCRSCGHTEHADLNAAKNIRNNYTLSLLPIGSVEQAAVNLPYVATVDQLAASQPPCAVGS